MKRIDHPITKVLFAVSLAALLGGAGCQEDEPEGYGSEYLEGSEPAPTAEPGLTQQPLGGETDATQRQGIGGEDPMLQNQAAIQQLVEARCQLAQRCGDIGADGDWASADECRQENLREYTEDLSAEECPGGVNATELRECIQAIGTQECNAPFDQLDRVIECRTSDMCNAIP